MTDTTYPTRPVDLNLYASDDFTRSDRRTLDPWLKARAAEIEAHAMKLLRTEEYSYGTIRAETGHVGPLPNKHSYVHVYTDICISMSNYPWLPYDLLEDLISKVKSFETSEDMHPLTSWGWSVGLVPNDCEPNVLHVNITIYINSPAAKQRKIKQHETTGLEQPAMGPYK